VTARTFTITLVQGEGMGAIPIPFDPKPVFGKVRAPVLVTVNGHTFRSTIAVMRGTTFVPFRASHREAAGVGDGGTITVRVELDTAPRVVTPPPDLLEALHAAPAAWQRWQSLSYTHQREYVEAIEGAKQPATRTRRIASTITSLTTESQ
jgi:hypothetical protein